MEIKKTTNRVKNYLVDTTSVLWLSTPVYSAMETLASGMSVATSLESRIKVACIAYAGLGTIYVKGRELSKKIFKINENSSEKKHMLHDSIYGAAFNISLSIPIYLTSGADLEQALKGTAGGVALGLGFSPIQGYSIDCFKDFAGTKKSDRKMPEFIKNAGKKMKRTLAVGMIAGMFAGTAGVYKIKDKFFPTPINQEQKLKKFSLEKRIIEIQPAAK
jgi:hypothetical protein